MTLHPQLFAIDHELVAVTDRARRLVADLDEATFQRRPDPTRWSVAEAFVHLNLTTLAFLPLIDSAIEAGRLMGIPAPRRFRLDFTGWLLCWMSEPPHRNRVRTTDPFLPAAPGPRERVMGDFIALQGELADRLRAAEGIDLGRLTIVSPLDSRLTYHLYSAFRVLPAHQRRHLWQAEQIVARSHASGADAA